MKKFLTAGFVSALFLISLTGCQNFIQNDPVVCTVVDKDRSTATVDGHSKSVFRVYTEGCGEDNATLGLGDNPFGAGYNSSDLYGKIKVGKTYEFKTVGYRNGFTSSFREIKSYREVDNPTPTK